MHQNQLSIAKCKFQVVLKVDFIKFIMKEQILMSRHNHNLIYLTGLLNHNSKLLKIKDNNQAVVLLAIFIVQIE